MKKTFVFFTAFIIICLTSCSTVNSNMKQILNDTQQAENRLKKILEGIEKKDKNIIKNLFSEKALQKSTNINEEINYLFELFQGDIVSYGWNGNTNYPLVDNLYENGNHKKELKSWFNVVTNKEKYIFFLLDYPVDTFESDNVGLYTLRVVKEKNSDTQLTNWQDMKIPGIYKP